MSHIRGAFFCGTNKIYKDKKICKINFMGHLSCLAVNRRDIDLAYPIVATFNSWAFNNQNNNGFEEQFRIEIIFNFCCNF